MKTLNLKLASFVLLLLFFTSNKAQTNNAAIPFVVSNALSCAIDIQYAVKHNMACGTTCLSGSTTIAANGSFSIPSFTGCSSSNNDACDVVVTITQIGVTTTNIVSEFANGLNTVTPFNPVAGCTGATSNTVWMTNGVNVNP